MSAPEPLAEELEPQAEEPARGWTHNPWIRATIVLALVSVGLLVWGLSTKSDLDDANKQVDQVLESDDPQAQLEEVKKELETITADCQKALG
jgi:hypothetical protein